MNDGLTKIGGLLKILEASEFATLAHAGQVRKYTGRPYIEHPRRVASKVYEFGAGADLVCAALLHDVVEDCNVSLKAVEDEFGMGVSDIVFWLTSYSKLNEVKGNRVARKAADLKKIREAPDEAKIIKLFDRLDNILELPAEEDFVRTYVRETFDLVNAIGYVSPSLSLKLEREARDLLSKHLSLGVNA